MTKALEPSKSDVPNGIGEDNSFRKIIDRNTSDFNITKALEPSKSDVPNRIDNDKRHRKTNDINTSDFHIIKALMQQKALEMLKSDIIRT